MSDVAIHRGLAASGDYELRPERKLPTNVPHIKSREHLDKFLTNSKVSEPPTEELPDRTPVITDAMRADTLRRLAAPVFVTESTLPDGTVVRSYKEDRTVKGDGIVDTHTHGVRADRDGDHSSTESIALLRKEGAVKVDGLLSKQSRDASGRFVKKAR